MTPEAARSLATARRLLAEGHAVLGIALAGVAGRSAYLAAFHAAQALILERTGRAARTHKGVQAEAVRLLRQASCDDREVLTFLSRAYPLKAIADYGSPVGEEVSRDRATEALAGAGRFVDMIEGLLSVPGPDAP